MDGRLPVAGWLRFVLGTDAASCLTRSLRQPRRWASPGTSTDPERLDLRRSLATDSSDSRPLTDTQSDASFGRLNPA